MISVWQWDEAQQIGTDYENVAEVEAYDSRMREVRDVGAENRRIIEMLQLQPGAHVLEIGTGTGAFARDASPLCAQVTAIDISPVMLEYAAQRARECGIVNITFQTGGFLTHQADAATYDAVVSGLALHHLPDVWKAVALERIYTWLKPGGRLSLRDVVFDWTGDQPGVYFDRIAGPDMPETSRHALLRHIRQEYSTLAWIMEGLLTRAGLEILDQRQDGLFLREYLCRKVG